MLIWIDQRLKTAHHHEQELQKQVNSLQTELNAAKAEANGASAVKAELNKAQAELVKLELEQSASRNAESEAFVRAAYELNFEISQTQAELCNVRSI